MERHYLNERKPVVRPSHIHRQPHPHNGRGFSYIHSPMQLPINPTQRTESYRKNPLQSEHLQFHHRHTPITPTGEGEEKHKSPSTYNHTHTHPTIYPSTAILYTYPYTPIVHYTLSSPYTCFLVHPMRPCVLVSPYIRHLSPIAFPYTLRVSVHPTIPYY